MDGEGGCEYIDVKAGLWKAIAGIEARLRGTGRCRVMN